jgi:hypothetical protein
MATLTTTPIKVFVSGETVTPTKLNELSQSTVALTAGTIVTADIASDAITTVKILDANVTTAKIADSAVTTAKVNDSAVTTAKINNAAVTAAKLDGAQTGSAPIYGCRAWVNFDGTKDTTGAASTANTNRLIRASGNVTSVLRNNTGDYTITFTTAMPDANYAAMLSGGSQAATQGRGFMEQHDSVLRSTTQLRIYSLNDTTSAVADSAVYSVAIFR